MEMSLMRTLWRFILISRPITYIPALGAFFVGLFANGDSVLAAGTFIGALLMTFPMGIVVYGINDIADRESDARNPRKGGIDGARLAQSENRLLLIVVVSVVIVSLLALLLLQYFGLALAMLLIYVFAYMYSAKPIRLKTRPGLDSLSNGILWVVGIYLAGYWANTQGFPLASPSLQILLAITLLISGLHALAATMDYEADKAVGDTTVAVALGKKKTLLLCILAFAAATIVRHTGGWSVDAYDVYMLAATGLTLSTLWRPSAKYIRTVCAALVLLLPFAIATNELLT